MNEQTDNFDNFGYNNKDLMIKLHPLITPCSNTHYDKGKQTGIEMLEEQFTVNDMLSFCKVNVQKYWIRREHKGQKDSDDSKINAYEKYRGVLEIMKNSGVGECIVEDAWKLLDIKWKFR